MISKFPFRNLVFQGGGVKSFAYHGALEVIEKYGVLSQIERVAGTSAGALLGTLLCFRLSVRETIDIFRTLDFSKVPAMITNKEDSHPHMPVKSLELGLDRLIGNIDGLSRFVGKYGWYTNDYGYDWLKDIIATFCQGNREASFQDFQRLGYRDLYVIATNLTTHEVVVFSIDTTPEVAVADAVLLSGSIPLYFVAPRFDGIRLGQGDYYADGGILNNYPIHIFDNEQFGRDNRHFVHGINWGTLGCRLYSPKDQTPTEKPITNIITYVENLVETMVEAQGVLIQENPVDRYRTIDISNCGVSTVDFHIRASEDDPKYIEMVDAGKSAAQHYLDNYKLPTDRFYALKAKLIDLLAKHV